MSAGQPSIYGPTRLWGPITLGSLACIYGPGTGNAGTLINTISVTNTLSNSTLAPGVQFYVVPSGFTGLSSNAYIFNAVVPSDGLPAPFVPNLAPPITLKNSEVIHALSSIASGYISFGHGIEMQ